jgi:putative hemolysin
VPREDIAGCDANAKKEELIAIMKKSRHNKIPIFENDISRIKGIVYTKEFMLNPKDEWTEYIKKPLYVHQNQTIDNLLVEFQDKRNFIAIIIDKTGAALGLVTLDDVLNEIGRQMRKEAKGK